MNTCQPQLTVGLHPADDPDSRRSPPSAVGPVPRTSAPVPVVMPMPAAAGLPPSLRAEALSEADWLLLVDAVGCRLRAVASNPGLATTVLPDCIEALRWLQGALPPRTPSEG